MTRKIRPAPPDVSETHVIHGDYRHDEVGISALINEIRETADKLERDNATRGDIKILARALKELRYAFKIFRPYRTMRKVTVFGSARLPPSHPAYQQAIEYGRRMSQLGWYVVTGAGGGIMEAAHVGAGRDMSMGINIMLPFEQEANHVIAGDEKLVHLKYFFTRKLLFVKEVHAIVLFAGGFGTQDECWETLTLVQTGKRDLMPIVCVDPPGGSYWKDWKKFVEKHLLNEGLISPEDMSLFRVVDNVDDAVSEITNFYSVYNSMRYIRGQLIIRLHQHPDDRFLALLNDKFHDLLESGRIERTTAHPFEADDEHLMHLPRLQLDFNRRDLGRLRQLVDFINEQLGEKENHVETP